MPAQARALWLATPGRAELRTEQLPEPATDEVRVRTLFSGISRGTETLVFRGEVPPSQQQAMRAPFQAGEFPAPVKYGYLNVGVVEAGPPELRGRKVFCLYPHQSRYVVPAAAVTPVPESVPAARAVLAGAVETAVNALWDAAPLVGDRIAVVGGGMVGGAVVGVLAKLPGARVQLIDADPDRAAVAEAFGVEFALPPAAAGECDLVFHASATDAGLARCLTLAAPEATVIELSWYGDRAVSAPLGEAFHSRRLTLRSSQVGGIAPARRGRRSHAERLALALRLLADPAFEVLISGESDFNDLPELLAEFARGARGALCHRVRYPTETDRTGE